MYVLQVFVLVLSNICAVLEYCVNNNQWGIHHNEQNLILLL